jgi:predicted DNA-binding WGR domain protein
MKCELVYMDATSSKFWNIELSGNSHTVTYGRIGTTGQTATKSFPSEDAARKDMDKLIREKVGKGYVDAATSGASSSGIGDGPIPIIAFSSINRLEDVSRNAGTFIGRRVVDFDPEKSSTKDVVYRFRSNWDEDNLLPNLKQFLAGDLAPHARGLVIGAWHGEDPEKSPEEIIQLLVKSRARLPNLSAIYVGDITSEENEISWIHQCDLSPLLAAFPSLQLLRSRGGDGLALSNPSHANLRALAIETGGLDVSVIRSVCTADLPRLEYLELWLGTEDYGANHTVADLQPILSGRLFPQLKYLGLRNAQHADDLAAVLVNSPLLQRIETLDLSLGVLTDEGEGLAPTASQSDIETAEPALQLHWSRACPPVEGVTFDRGSVQTQRNGRRRRVEICRRG